MKKKFKPYYFALVSAVIIAGSSQLLLLILLHFFAEKINFLIPVISFIFVFALSYLITYFYLKKYLYTKINRMIRNIIDYNTPSSFAKKTSNFRKNIFENLEEEVKVWIDENKKEIDKYKVLSDYRKQFLGDISHELKTPIFSIQGYLLTLLDGAIYDKKNNVLFLKRAIQNVERLESIISDLDMISKLEAGEMKFKPIRFSIKKLFSEVFEELAYQSSQDQIKLGFKSDSKDGYWVFADKKQIRHVCSNLVANGISYGRKGGFVHIGFEVLDSKLRIDVSDNGIGIPEKHIAHLFDRFYRIDPSRSRNKGGSGLGLSIVKHILTAHKQQIRVTSQQDKGSKFSFTLELADEG